MYGFWSCVMSHPGHLLCLLEYLTLRALYWPSVLGPTAAVAVRVGCGPLIAPSLSPSFLSVGPAQLALVPMGRWVILCLGFDKQQRRVRGSVTEKTSTRLRLAQPWLSCHGTPWWVS